MIGRKISVVTLDGGKALSRKFPKGQASNARPANQIEEIQIGGLTPDGLHESGVFPVL